jgi:hypothetical protein
MFDGCYLVYSVLAVATLISICLSLETNNWKYMFCIIPLSLGFFVILVMIIAVPPSQIPKEAEYYTRNTTHIYTLRTVDSISGDFILGSGSIEGITYYVYYTKSSDNGFNINKVEAEQCTIYMDDRQDGVLLEIWAKWNQSTTDRRWWFNRDQFVRYELCVPKGSLIQQYDIR